LSPKSIVEVERDESHSIGPAQRIRADKRQNFILPKFATQTSFTRKPLNEMTA